MDDRALPARGFPSIVAVLAHERQSADGHGWWQGYNGRTKTYHRGEFVIRAGHFEPIRTKEKPQ